MVQNLTVGRGQLGGHKLQVRSDKSLDKEYENRKKITQTEEGIYRICFLILSGVLDFLLLEIIIKQQREETKTCQYMFDETKSW